MHRLITFRFSHYNEKARWALDRFGVAYRETAVMPLLHVPVILAATRGRFRGRSDSVSTRFSTPVLLTDEGGSIHDSSEIVQYVSRRYASDAGSLYPTPEVETLEKRFHDRLASDTRRIGYESLLASPNALPELARRNVGAAQAMLFDAVLPLFRQVIRRRLDVNRERIARSLADVRAELGWVDERLADGRRYLTGDRFTAADLAFACALAPGLLVQPHEGFGGHLPSVHECGEAYAAYVREFRATRAGDFALRMFAEERGRRRAT